MRTGIEFAKLKEIGMGLFKRPKVWSSTRMVVYEFEMVERFLENSMYLDIPTFFFAFGTVSLPIHVCFENCAGKRSKHRCVQCLHRKCHFE